MLYNKIQGRGIMSKVIEIVFHNGEELKKELDAVEVKIENRSNFMFLNHAVLIGQIDVIGDKVVQKDYNGNTISEIDCNKIFSFKIYSDEKGGYEDWDDYEKCYSFVNHQLQFLDDFDRANFAYDLLKKCGEDEYILPEELEEAVFSHIEQGSGKLIIPDTINDDDEEDLKKGIISHENFIKLVQFKVESNSEIPVSERKIRPKLYNGDSLQIIEYNFEKK